MDWLLSDMGHFFGFILGAGVMVLVVVVVGLVWAARNRPALIHHNPEQLTGPYLYASEGVYLGNAEKEGGPARFFYDGPAHITTIGPTRTGKSRRLLIPNLALDVHRSMVVIDIKGELAAITGEWRSRFGEVVYLNPFGLFARNERYMLASAGFNPLLALDPESPSFVDDCMMLAEGLCPAEANTQQPHFPESAQNLIAGLIMFVRLVGGKPEGVFWPSPENDIRGRVLAPTFGEVRRLLAAIPEVCFIELVKAMMRYDKLPAVGAKVAQFEAGARDNKELASILSTARTQTAFLDSPAIAGDLAKDGVDFASLKQETKTVYLILPPRLIPVHAKWLRLVIDSAVRAMQTDVGLDRPAVLFMLDEFAQLGRMKAIETAVTLAAGYGVKIWAVIQNINQIKRIYQDNWESFIDGGVTTVFQCRDVATPEYLSKLSGTRIVRERSESSGPSGQSFSEAEKRREYLISQHFYNLKFGEIYIYEPTPDGRRLHEIAAPDFSEMPLEVDGKTVDLRPPPLSTKQSKQNWVKAV